MIKTDQMIALSRAAFFFFNYLNYNWIYIIEKTRIINDILQMLNIY